MKKLEAFRYFWWQYKKVTCKTTAQMLKSWWGPLRTYLSGGEVYVYNVVRTREVDK